MDINNFEKSLAPTPDQNDEHQDEDLSYLITEANEQEKAERLKAKKCGSKVIMAWILTGTIAAGAAGGLVGYLFGRNRDNKAKEAGEGQKPQTTTADNRSTSFHELGSTIGDEATVKPNEADKNHAEFIKNGYIDTANGPVECFIYKGGYHEEDDPYLAKFAHQNDVDYEGDHTYGTSIEGETIAEKTANWLKRVAKSPEATVRLRTQMGLEPDLDSTKAENELANKIRTMSPDEYDKIVNDTLRHFYSNLKGGYIEESTDWVLESDIRDERTGNHADSELYGRFAGDDMIGGTKDKLVTFYNSKKENIISNEPAMRHVLESAIENNNGYQTIDKISYIDYINYTDGGTHCFKPGGTTNITPPETPPTETPAPTPTETPAPTPTITPPGVTGGGFTPHEYIPPAPTQLSEKDPLTEIIRANDGQGIEATPTSLNESITPETDIKEDQEKFKEIADQQKEEVEKAEEAKKIKDAQKIAEEKAKAEAKTSRPDPIYIGGQEFYFMTPEESMADLEAAATAEGKASAGATAEAEEAAASIPTPPPEPTAEDPNAEAMSVDDKDRDAGDWAGGAFDLPK